MIHGLFANKSSFHAVSFTAGLNVILADRSVASTEKDTRNGIGKSTLIEVIDFCLGSRARSGSGLVIEPLNDWAFTLDLTLRGNRVRVTRAVAEHSRIVVDGSTFGWPEQSDTDYATGARIFSVERWRSLLGWALFDLPPSANQFTYKPSYRSLISYFIRRGPDAYTNPFRHFRQQKTWDIQLHVAYLLGMSWEYASQWQSLKDREKGVKAFETAIATGVIEGALGTVGELETLRVQLEEQVEITGQALQTFRVHPQYESLQGDADRLTSEIHALANRNVTDRRKLARYEESLNGEAPPAAMSLERVYEESGLLFPGQVKRTLEEARAFHRNIVSNRREFLEAEVARVRAGIAEREGRIIQLTEQRADVMQVLQSHGALQELTRLQEEHVVLRGSLDRVESRLLELRSLKSTKREVRTARAKLTETAERDREERRDIWSAAVRLFNENSQALYKTPGRLIIDVDDTGYRYNVEIERSGSEGIEKMKIFCFDLALLQLQMQRGRGIDFLIHDTLMYDSVDARQRALAFERAHEVSTALGGQYICTINSDMVPSADFTRDFDFDKYVRLRLSDASPSESLLGIRFERGKK